MEYRVFSFFVVKYRKSLLGIAAAIRFWNFFHILSKVEKYLLNVCWFFFKISFKYALCVCGAVGTVVH